jgi:serine-aspartate repeat-containing protein C/D/E
LDLPPGVYQVRQTKPDGLFSVGAIPGTIDGQRVGVALEDLNTLSGIALELGDQRAVNYDFALARPAELQGYVYHDRDNDGRRDPGEEGIRNVTVQLVPIQTLGQSTTVTVTTDATGSYRAAGLAPGPIEWSSRINRRVFRRLDAAGNVSGTVRGIAQNPGDVIEGVFLGGGEQGRDYNFGELLPAQCAGPCPAGRRGRRLLRPMASANRPVAGARVELFDAAGRLVASTVTDSQGAIASANSGREPTRSSKPRPRA